MNQSPDVPVMDDEGVNLLDYLAVLVNHLRLIVSVVAVTVITAVIGVFVQTSIYTASTTVLPTQGGGGGSLGSLAGLTGLSGLGGLAGGVEGSSQLFPDILKSRSLLARVVQRSFATTTRPDSAMLIEIFGVRRKDEVGRLEVAVRILRERLRVMTDPRTGIVTVSVDAVEPQLAADLANAVIEELKAYNQNVRISRAKENRIFIEKRLAETDSALKAAEETMKIFRERNRMIDFSPELQLIQGRLTREVAIQQGLFTTLKQQFELARIEEIKETPVVNVLDTAIPPFIRTRPKRTQTVLLAGVVSLFLGVFLAFVLQYTEHMKRDGESTAKLVAILGTLRHQIRWRKT
ncbi:MAG: hypothetical protein HY709_01670 [Candidatus Latescibacteria bacterium]|nr:hypothetical protein [Candidatus Latescibacterota bacterium]